MDVLNWPRPCIASCARVRLAASDVTLLLRQIQHDSGQGHIVWLPLTEHLLHEAVRQYETLGVTVFLRAADSLLTCARLNGLAEIYSNDLKSALPVHADYRLRTASVGGFTSPKGSWTDTVFS
jgi:hypothetical protein